ncbi:MAG: hypothetical protein HYV34_04895 [Candidatus Kerfeldbacteria bacterium]|nr:hypothetical protein [Candidatus Kerfeldbacteria bacterium]
MVRDTRVLDDGTTLELVNLLDQTVNKLYGATPDALQNALAHDRLVTISGEFAVAMLALDRTRHIVFRGARTIGVPARVARQTLTSTHKRLIVAHTIREIREAWERDLPAGIEPVKEFSPSYTAMFPAFRAVTIHPWAWDAEWETTWFLPGPEYAPYPLPNLLPADLGVIGARLIEALKRVITDQLALIPDGEPIMVSFSGGADSTSVLVTLLETIRSLSRTNRVVGLTLAIDGGGSDLAQAEKVASVLAVRFPEPAFAFRPLVVASDPATTADLQTDAALLLEEYHARDVECGMAGMLLGWGATRAREEGELPEIRFEFNGDGGNELFCDYPREDEGYSRIALDEVLANPFLYFLGHAPGTHHHSSVFSDGLSRAYTRTINPARANGVTTFSPFIDRHMVDLGQRLPLVEFARIGADLHALRPEAVRLGLKQVYGIDLPAFPKARFQEGCSSDPSLLRVTREDSLRLRQLVLHP